MGWGDQNPMETYLLYHSSNKGKSNYYNPQNYENPIVDRYLEEALRMPDLDRANEIWKKVQWDGTTGTSTLGDAPWVWLVNINHLYYIKRRLEYRRAENPSPRPRMAPTFKFGGMEMGEMKIISYITRGIL